MSISEYIKLYANTSRERGKIITGNSKTNGSSGWDQISKPKPKPKPKPEDFIKEGEMKL